MRAGGDLFIKLNFPLIFVCEGKPPRWYMASHLLMPDTSPVWIPVRNLTFTLSHSERRSQKWMLLASINLSSRLLFEGNDTGSTSSFAAKGLSLTYICSRAWLQWQVGKLLAKCPLSPLSFKKERPSPNPNSVRTPLSFLILCRYALTRKHTFFSPCHTKKRSERRNSIQLSILECTLQSLLAKPSRISQPRPA